MQLLFLFIFLTSIAYGNSVCSDLKDDCEYYTCLAREKHCGPQSYPLAFGRKYCLKYGSRMNSFSTQGQKWIDDVRMCLIQEMESFESALTCSQLKRRAFRSHVPCYIKSGFCTLNFKDKKQVLKIVWPVTRNVFVLADGINVFRSCLSSQHPYRKEVSL